MNISDAAGPSSSTASTASPTHSGRSHEQLIKMMEKHISLALAAFRASAQ
ncbi:hypothetical protein [Xanthomonas nasturtii]|uniref:Uncharacterized protein n=1 Tax=Xanthomonas nasturtii TaxID=1843581 RepID=A0ABT0LXZ8_9XANT|nr:hypothetical protein [Xanthomonas nasturtii]MCL1553769.1 hypothetical protein [Xanthomonas nasturtii]MCL1557839.1 hypothetical protein [Xanthomonas nasturtii]MCL1561778.1 hypothetical protein [Xanthomonas nasturtii]